MNRNLLRFIDDRLLDSERFFTLTNPIFYIFLMLSFIYVGLLVVIKFIWNSKRWYFQEWDYMQFKKLIKSKSKTGFKDDELKYLGKWIRRNPKHRRIKEIKEFLERYQGATHDNKAQDEFNTYCSHPQFDILGCPYDNQECQKCQYNKDDRGKEEIV